jgi:hypothetical protein
MNAGRKETTHANDILWAAPDGSVRVMERATQDVTAEEIAAIEDNDHHPRPSCESKPEDWGRLEDGSAWSCSITATRATASRPSWPSAGTWRDFRRDSDHPSR